MTDTSNSRSDEDANKLLAELVEIENYANAIVAHIKRVNNKLRKQLDEQRERNQL